MGFEPTVPFGTLVFKTSSFNRSDTLPIADFYCRLPIVSSYPGIVLPIRPPTASPVQYRQSQGSFQAPGVLAVRSAAEIVDCLTIEWPANVNVGLHAGLIMAL